LASGLSPYRERGDIDYVIVWSVSRWARNHQARRPSCGARHLPVADVEKAIEDFYRSVQLTPEQVEQVRRDVGEQTEERLAVARKQSEHHSRKLRILQEEQQKLVQLYYKGGVSEEVLQAEQTRIEGERTQAHHWIEAAAHEAHDVREALDEALTIIGRCQETYRDASPMLKRLMNQVIFEQLLIRRDSVECEQQPVFGHITRLGRGCQAPAKAPRRPQNAQDPRSFGGLGSNVDTMVRMRGLEPPPGCPDTDLNRARLPIPPHPRAACEDIADAAGGTRADGLDRARDRAHGLRSALRYASGAGFASLGATDFAPLSSRGLGRRPLMAETRVRIPVAVSRSALAPRGPVCCSTASAASSRRAAAQYLFAIVIAAPMIRKATSAPTTAIRRPPTPYTWGTTAATTSTPIIAGTPNQPLPRRSCMQQA
jgi:hypothetical protein